MYWGSFHAFRLYYLGSLLSIQSPGTRTKGPNGSSRLKEHLKYILLIKQLFLELTICQIWKISLRVNCQLSQQPVIYTRHNINVWYLFFVSFCNSLSGDMKTVYLMTLTLILWPQMSWTWHFIYFFFRFPAQQICYKKKLYWWKPLLLYQSSRCLQLC